MRRHELLLDLNNDGEVSSSEVQSAEEILKEVEQLKRKIPRAVRRAGQQGDLESKPLEQWEQRMWSLEGHLSHTESKTEL